MMPKAFLKLFGVVLLVVVVLPIAVYILGGVALFWWDLFMRARGL